jgi:cytochrome c-type biogenesis protein CcmH
MRAPAILVVVALALVAARVAMAGGGDGPPNAADLEAELVCPTCRTTLDQSDAPIARQMKAFVRERIAAGDTAAEIKAQLVEQFGPGVIATPPKRGFHVLVWALPIVAALIGALVAAWLIRRWSRGREREEDLPEGLDPADERRLDEELARFEGP